MISCFAGVSNLEEGLKMGATNPDQCLRDLPQVKEKALQLVSDKEGIRKLIQFRLSKNEAPISEVEISIAEPGLETGKAVAKSKVLDDGKPVSLPEANLIQRGEPLLVPSPGAAASSSSSSASSSSPPTVLLDESESGEFICSVAEGKLTTV